MRLPFMRNMVMMSFPTIRSWLLIHPLRRRAVWVPTLVGHALPGGTVTREAYESLVGKTLDSLRVHGPYDGLYFDIHGAMSVEGLDDPEGDFISRIRKVIGKTALISTSMDLHGNVSWVLAENTDLITDYRLAPHEDAMETKQRAIEDLLGRLESGIGKPAYKAWVSITRPVARRKNEHPDRAGRERIQGHCPRACPGRYYRRWHLGWVSVGRRAAQSCRCHGHRRQ